MFCPGWSQAHPRLSSASLRSLSTLPHSIDPILPAQRRQGRSLPSLGGQPQVLKAARKQEERAPRVPYRIRGCGLGKAHHHWGLKLNWLSHPDALPGKPHSSPLPSFVGSIPLLLHLPRAWSRGAWTPNPDSTAGRLYKLLSKPAVL